MLLNLPPSKGQVRSHCLSSPDAQIFYSISMAAYQGGAYQSTHRPGADQQVTGIGILPTGIGTTYMHAYLSKAYYMDMDGGR